MRYGILFGIAFGVAVAQTASAAPITPPKKFPVQADVFRGWVDQLLNRARDACNAHCNAKQHSDFEGAVAKVRMRVQEACRDGSVTESEADWALAPLDEVGNEQEGEEK